MKQHIDTIPVWDAYKADCECPLCHIEKQNEAMYVENFLGGSVMEPATRIEVNEKGFCADHFRLLLGAGNKLGVALMAHTHLKETMNALKAAAKDASGAGKKNASLFAIFGAKDKSAESAQYANGCILCERLNTTMDRYVYTLLYMWKHESDFRKAFEKSKGLCLPHYARVLEEAPRHIPGADAERFIEMLINIEETNLSRLEKEIEWFTLKFDYRNSDKPWGTSQDAVERALLKLRGFRTEFK